MLNTVNLNTRKCPEMGGSRVCNHILNGKIVVTVKYGVSQLLDAGVEKFNFHSIQIWNDHS